METLRLIRRGFEALPGIVTQFGFRADSACFDARTLHCPADPQRLRDPRGPIGFPCGWDLTKVLHAVGTDAPPAMRTFVEDRSAETVQCADAKFIPGGWPTLAALLRSVALRIRRHQGLSFAGADATSLAVAS